MLSLKALKVEQIEKLNQLRLEFDEQEARLNQLNSKISYLEDFITEIESLEEKLEDEIDELSEHGVVIENVVTGDQLDEFLQVDSDIIFDILEKVETFSPGIDEDLQRPEERWRELLASLRYIGNSAYPRLTEGKKWGDWDLDKALRYFGKIVDILRNKCFFPIIPPRLGESEYDSSYWKCYRAGAEKGYVKTKAPDEKEAREWDKKRKDIIKAEEESEEIENIEELEEFEDDSDEFVELPKSKMAFAVERVRKFLQDKSIVFTQRPYDLPDGEVNAQGIGRATRKKIGEVTPELLRKHLGQSGFDTVDEWNKAKFGKDKKMWLYEVKKLPEIKKTIAKTMAIVGSRDTTPNMLKAAQLQTRKALDAGWNIVTGGAIGIDEEAIREVLKHDKDVKRLTVYLPKTIADQPASVRPLLEKTKSLGAKIIENEGFTRAVKETGRDISKITFPQALFTRNKSIIDLADGVVAIPKDPATSKGTMHSVRFATEKGIPVKQIDAKGNTLLLKKIAGRLQIKNLGNMAKVLGKALGKTLPLIVPIWTAIDLKKLWDDLEDLEKDVKEGKANEDQVKLWDYLQTLKASEEEFVEILEGLDDEDYEEEAEDHAGLYLVEPHAELIWAESKPAIIKSKKFTAHIDEPLYLISGHKCWGIIKLSEPFEIKDQEKFDELYSEHLIENSERKKWWNDTYPLYFYRVKLVEKYDEPKDVDIPQGVQIFILPNSITWK